MIGSGKRKIDNDKKSRGNNHPRCFTLNHGALPCSPTHKCRDSHRYALVRRLTSLLRRAVLGFEQLHSSPSSSTHPLHNLQLRVRLHRRQISANCNNLHPGSKVFRAGSLPSTFPNYCIRRHEASFTPSAAVVKSAIRHTRGSAEENFFFSSIPHHQSFLHHVIPAREIQAATE